MEKFNYTADRFADIQMLRYRLEGFENLTLRQKVLIYYLSQATIYGRDITFDQYGKYNLAIRKMLETVYLNYDGDRQDGDFAALETYLKRVWFSNGIHHHYGCEKFSPGFSEHFLRCRIDGLGDLAELFTGGRCVDDFCKEIFPVIFNPDVFPKRVNKADGVDLVRTSACNFYENVTQQEVEDYYKAMKTANGAAPMSYGLNSTLVKEDGEIKEVVWREGGKYGAAISKIVEWLGKALDVAENECQRRIIGYLISYYKSGDLNDFDKYNIEWVSEHEGKVDFINGFIEVYGDPLGMKATWEGIVEYRDEESSKRTRTVSDNAQWFEDNSPVDERFKKETVTGVSANVVCAAMLGGEEYPSTAIGINLPNADWIRAEYGSKSVTISNITAAYNEASKESGFKEEFVIDSDMLRLVGVYGNKCDDLHTDLHECLGHGSGKLLPGVDPDALRAYGSTIEEARADLFALYYMADEKLIELGLLPDKDAYKAQYYTYIMNGLVTQLVRIKPGNDIEEAHMRNRALIARWCLEKGKPGNVIELVRREGKTYVRINDYDALRGLFAQLLAEIQRIKSEGDYEAARDIVESYGVAVDGPLHEEILQRYSKLNVAPYKGFINPVLKPVVDDSGNITDVAVDYSESYTAQMLRYSKEYATLI